MAPSWTILCQQKHKQKQTQKQSRQYGRMDDLLKPSATEKASYKPSLAGDSVRVCCLFAFCLRFVCVLFVFCLRFVCVLFAFFLRFFCVLLNTVKMLEGGFELFLSGMVFFIKFLQLFNKIKQ